MKRKILKYTDDKCLFMAIFFSELRDNKNGLKSGERLYNLVSDMYETLKEANNRG